MSSHFPNEGDSLYLLSRETERSRLIVLAFDKVRLNEIYITLDDNEKVDQVV